MSSKFKNSDNGDYAKLVVAKVGNDELSKNSYSNGKNASNIKKNNKWHNVKMLDEQSESVDIVAVNTHSMRSENKVENVGNSASSKYSEIPSEISKDKNIDSQYEAADKVDSTQIGKKFGEKNNPVEHKGVKSIAYERRLGARTLEFLNSPRIVTTSSIVGPKEANDQLGKYFEIKLSDDTMLEASYEKAEKKLFCEVVERAIDKAGDNHMPQVLLGGDLLNQIISTSFAARELKLPLLGLYSACSTITESLIVGSMLVDGGYFNDVICTAVSHFSSAERQYRFPLEQGTQRPPVSQWTVTGGGAIIIGKEGSLIIKRATIGKVVDFGVLDTNNMGAAMAPAAFDTLNEFLTSTNTKTDDYDLILSGDLGTLGGEILVDLCKSNHITLGENYRDCGDMVYSHDKNVYQGGSGAGCSAAVFSSYIMHLFDSGEINNCLFLATGALLSPTSSLQGESIPGISHLIEVVKE